MKKIQMVDLHSQYLRIKKDIDQAINNVIESSAFIKGPQVSQFNNDLANYLKCKHVISCANGTDALQIALMALELNPGDKVLVPDFTFIASAEIIALLGLVPVFVDIDIDTFLIDINDLEKKITPDVKAIIAVHLFGQCANIQEITKLAIKHNLAIVEDNAQAMGASLKLESQWIKSGTASHIGCTSFFPSKNLGCFGDGGALSTNNDELAERIRCIANHGGKVKYVHERIGINSRLDTIQAAILIEKLKHLDTYNSKRAKAAKIYNELLSSIGEVQTPVVAENTTHVYHQYTLKAKDRDSLKEYLAKKDIPSMIYYPIGMHNQQAYKTEEIFPVADKVCNQVLSLPMHTELEPEQQQYIANAVKSFYTDKKSNS